MAPKNGVVNRPEKKIGTTSRICFAQEFHKVRVIPHTAQAAGYAHICAATGQANTETQEQIEQTHAQGLANLATAITAGRQKLGTLSTTNATLNAELRAETTLITKLQRQLTLYMDASLPPPATPTTCACVPIDPKGYCWSHGYRVSTAHNSRTCNNTIQGHQKYATRNKPMGGSTKNKPE